MTVNRTINKAKTLSEMAREPFGLTELIVADCLIWRYSNSKIAAMTGYSLKNVNTICASICRKTGYKSKRELLNGDWNRVV